MLSCEYLEIAHELFSGSGWVYEEAQVPWKLVFKTYFLGSVYFIVQMKERSV